jgi:glycosyltransferase involved in cell wall biosynthesis
LDEPKGAARFVRASKMMERPLPRLVYLGDVPVESSYHGSALLFRLLQDYPPERLLVLETTPWPSRPDRRLPGVKYAPFPIRWGKLLKSRFAGIYGSWIARRATADHPKMARLIRDFQPEAVMTVAQGYTWLTAAAFAEAHHVPLHLVLHDDWLLGLIASRRLQPWAHRELGHYYRAAHSRLCVSPAMRERYRSHYGAEGSVLYPSRAKDCPAAEAPAARLRENLGRGPVFAYAGSINYPGYVTALRLLAEILQPLGGKLLLYGQQSQMEKLAGANVEWRGLLSSADLIADLRREADAMFVPMSFAPEDRPNMEISFPSKLTDSTAVGLPLLIYGPEYCSAVRWVRENPDAAEMVDTENREALAAAVGRLAQDPERRVRLAERALELGQRYFSHGAATRIFFDALRAADRPH